MRPSATRPFSITRLRMAGSMLPPQKGSTTHLPASSGSLPARHAASPVAPEPSTMAFSSSTMRRMARAISSSLTVTSLSMRSRAMGESVRADVRHRQAVREGGVAGDLHGRAPRRPPPRTSPRPSGSTPMIWTSGRSVLMASAIPASSPPPPTGDDDRLHVGHLFHDLQAHRALPGDDRRIVVAVDVGVAVLLPEAAGVVLGFQKARAVEGSRSRRAAGRCCT